MRVFPASDSTGGKLSGSSVRCHWRGGSPLHVRFRRHFNNQNNYPIERSSARINIISQEAKSVLSQLCVSFRWGKNGKPKILTTRCECVEPPTATTVRSLIIYKESSKKGDSFSIYFLFTSRWCVGVGSESPVNDYGNLQTIISTIIIIIIIVIIT